METTTRILAAGILLLGVFTGPMSETARIGGSGGTRTVEMDCGANAYIVGITATGGRDNPFGFNLLRDVKFACRTFSGTTPTGSTFQTAEAAATQGQARRRDRQSQGLLPQLRNHRGAFDSTRIDATASPNPSSSTPLVIPVKSNRTISFNASLPRRSTI
jgi:hypothetical protein